MLSIDEAEKHAHKFAKTTIKQDTFLQGKIAKRKLASEDDLTSMKTEKAILKIENLIKERKKQRNDITKKQIPHANAKAKSQTCNQKCVTINDIYDDKLASQPITKKKRSPLHPAKLNRLYRRQKLSKQWQNKNSPKYCKACLKEKWRSKVHKRPQTLFIYERKHRPGKFLSRTDCEKRKTTVSWAILQIIYRLGNDAVPAKIYHLLRKKWGFSNLSLISFYNNIRWLECKSLIEEHWRCRNRFLIFKVGKKGKALFKHRISQVQIGCKMLKRPKKRQRCLPSIPRNMSIKTQWRKKLKDLYG